MIHVVDCFCVYRGHEHDVAALRGLSLHIAAGERVLVHGPSGAGKTTLLRVLAGEQRPSAGRVLVAERELARLTGSALDAYRRDVLGIVLQRSLAGLPPELTCEDGVALGLRLRGRGRVSARAAARVLLGDVGLPDLARRMPSTLSGGQLQRVAVCAALAHEPEVILADEPTGELDRVAADAVYDLLSALARRTGATLVIVSHDGGAERVADRVVHVRDGRVSEQRRAGDRDDALVIDDRGWLRLPDVLRWSLGEAVHARAEGGVVLLAAAGADATPTPVVAPVASSPGAGAPVAVLDGVAHPYAPGLPAGLVVRAGEVVVLAGRSGSGKTTALRILASLEPPAAGSVTLAGTPLVGDRSARARLRRRLVAIAAQGGGLAEALDPAANIALGRAVRGLERDSDRVAALVAALALEPVLGRPVRGLSGGERQRVAIARALAADVPLVLLDEPTSQLDEANAERVARLLRSEAARGVAIVCASHDPVIVAAADVVVGVDQAGPTAA